MGSGKVDQKEYPGVWQDSDQLRQLREERRRDDSNAKLVDDCSQDGPAKCRRNVILSYIYFCHESHRVERHSELHACHRPSLHSPSTVYLN